ncbi:response regulator [Litoribacter alkaliphilus]|uniref:Response regulator n=1 Tax=Litoribacter ruber TaxID=702568 RepID=A0AAP2G1P4_9BACT|nr:response regulator [Litoribacter alkaliphilus]MBS9524512.1 response regulator [Litoribacter alkaliphilus]
MEGKILLAEDNTITQKFMKAMLNQWGYEVVLVGDGRQVLEEIERNQFDILILDYQMPEMDGLETFKKINKKKTLIGNAEVIFLTGETSPTVISNLKETGVGYFLRKPVNLQVLFSILDQLMIKVKKKEKRQSNFSTAYLNDITCSNSELMQEVIDIFIKEVPDSIFQLKSHFLLEDWDSLIKLSHKVKANFSYLELYEPLMLMEEVEVKLENEKDRREILPLIVVMEEYVKNAIVKLNNQKINNKG